jgi:hypothetical protein
MVKKKTTQNLSTYSAYKILIRMRKTRSPHSIVFVTNDPDGWFIHCIEYKTKSGIIAHDDFIIEKDMACWVKWHEGMGWEKV